MVEEELARLGEQRVTSSEGTVAVALELCREFEDRFLQHINTGEVSSRLYICLFRCCQAIRQMLCYEINYTHMLETESI